MYVGYSIATSPRSGVNPHRARTIADTSHEPCKSDCRIEYKPQRR